MLNSTLAPHDGLCQHRRFAWLSAGARQASLTDVAWLLASGFLAAACSILIDTNLRLPGNAILRAVLPMAIGLAAAPRRGAGVVMGVGAACGALFFPFAGWGKGVGATTSLLLLGPMLDLALRGAQRGWRVYGGFALAGLLANLGAFAVQWQLKTWGWAGGGGRSVAAWLSLSLVTYPAWGLLAGLVSAAICFRWSADKENAS